MTTKVKVFAGDVIAIAKLGISNIRAQRLVNVDQWLESAMLERKPAFLFSCFGTVPRYADRAEAMAAMKTPVDMSSVSIYLWKTRYYKRTDEHRLIGLSNMAQSSVDDTIYLGGEDHALIRQYAEGYLWLAGKEKA